MSYYPRLRDCRDDADYTQAQLGARLGIDQRVYSNYETGKRMIPVDVLIELARLYGTSLDYLVGLTNEHKPYPRK
ncbi:helix-turn-helix domain-containing protein [Clostridia bacterium OttesenSCG-928-O13]|nr:helix-turn-helix domain-containing protein [Clostridia bacterium OttesenSCG-928-O13]